MVGLPEQLMKQLLGLVAEDEQRGREIVNKEGIIILIKLASSTLPLGYNVLSRLILYKSISNQVLVGLIQYDIHWRDKFI